MNKFLKHLKALYEHMDYYNNMAPFPPYDTEYVEALRITIIKMESKTRDYDNMPVAACSHCKSLYIEVDELENDICMRCGSINELTTYKNIEEYLEQVKNEN